MSVNSEIFLCKTSHFLEDYGPCQVDESVVQSCKDFLVRKKVLAKMPKNESYRWIRYKKNPSAMPGTERKVFVYLNNIVQKIFDYATTDAPGRGNNYIFKLMPYKHLNEDIGKMAACIVEEDHAGVLPVINGIVPHEFKKQCANSVQEQAPEQIVIDCQRILAEDPRRMFIYAITIEDTRLSVWYFSRTHSVKAFDFDRIEKDINTFIQVFLAFACATPEELGLDPRVHKAPGDTNEGQQYIYECPTEWDLPEIDPGLVEDERIDIPSAPTAYSAIADGGRLSSRLAHSKVAAARAEAANVETAKCAAARQWSAKRTPTKFKYYKTIQAISDIHPYRISGRITRVWKVIEVDSIAAANEIDGAEPVILKDTWLEEARLNEAENMDRIFTDIEKLLDRAKQIYPGANWMSQLMEGDPRFEAFDQATKDRLQLLLTDGAYKSLFLTKLHAWKGEVSKAVSKNCNLPSIDVVYQRSITEVQSVVPSHSATTVTRSDTAAAEVPQKDNLEVNKREGRLYASKQQSRFIYKEVCNSLWDLRTMGNLMSIIDQALDALRILFCAGWVHKDISSGNLIVFREEGNASWKLKLADLEFSEKLGYNNHRSDPRIGTPYFMPYEIMDKKHIVHRLRFPSHLSLSMVNQLNLAPGTYEYDILQDFDKFGDYTTLPANATSEVPSMGDPVRYNYQHDLESIYWLVLYVITACVRNQKSREYSKTVFIQSMIIPNARADCFVGKVTLEIRPFINPKLIPILTMLECLRVRMIDRYRAIEAFGLLNVDEAYSDIHHTFAMQFRELLSKNKGGWKQVTVVGP